MAVSRDNAHVATVLSSGMLRIIAQRGIALNGWRGTDLDPTDSRLLDRLAELRPTVLLVGRGADPAEPYELLHRVRSEGAATAARILFCSDEAHELSGALNRGADAVIASPFGAEDVAETLRQLTRLARTVLYVDDSPFMHHMVVPKLKEQGIEVRQAFNGAEALDLVRLTRFDLIVADVEMPVMDGLALCRAVKREPDASDVPVIMISSLDSAEQIREGYDAGADDYLTKPITVEEIVSRIKRQLGV